MSEKINVKALVNLSACIYAEFFEPRFKKVSYILFKNKQTSWYDILVALKMYTNKI
jgi:hypothetical protein